MGRGKETVTRFAEETQFVAASVQTADRGRATFDIHVKQMNLFSLYIAIILFKCYINLLLITICMMFSHGEPKLTGQSPIRRSVS